MSYSSDSPITSYEQDRFERAPFAEKVAGVIKSRTNPDSIVIGIHGPWGDGKSSVLNLIGTSLTGLHGIKVFRYNPWRFSGEEQMLRSFIVELARAIDVPIVTEREKRNQYLQSIADMLPAGPDETKVGFHTLDSTETEFVNRVRLDDLRNRIETTLAQGRQRVVIMIDDIDRLEKDEIYAVFRLVKLTARFDYVVYLLAFDESMVIGALRDRYGDSGQSFLEKIVQVPLHVPYAIASQLQTFCLEQIGQALESAGIELTDAEQSDFHWQYRDSLQIRLSTPRQAILYGNSLSFVLPMLKGEVNTVDVLLLEAMKVFYPRVYRLVRGSSWLLFEGVPLATPDSTRKARISKEIDKAIQPYDPEEQRSAKQLLISLFPQLNDALEMHASRGDRKSEYELRQRVALRTYYDRYFSYTVPEGDVPDQAIVDLIGKAAFESDAEMEELVAGMMRINDARQVIEKLSLRRSSVSTTQARNLAVALSMSGHLLNNGDWGGFNLSTRNSTALLIYWLLLNIDLEERLVISIDLVRSAQPLSFAYQIYNWSEPSDKAREKSQRYTEVQYSQLGNVLAQRISKELQETPFVEFESFQFLLNHWAKVEGTAITERYLTAHLSQRPDFVLRLLVAFSGLVWHGGDPAPVSHQFDQDRYAELAKVIDPELVVETLQRSNMLPAEPIVNSHRDEPWSEMRTIREFLWVHAQAGSPTPDNESNV